MPHTTVFIASDVFRPRHIALLRARHNVVNVVRDRSTHLIELRIDESAHPDMWGLEIDRDDDWAEQTFDHAVLGTVSEIMQAVFPQYGEDWRDFDALGHVYVMPVRSTPLDGCEFRLGAGYHLLEPFDLRVIEQRSVTISYAGMLPTPVQMSVTSPI